MMETNKCGCGKDGRYFVTESGEMACNKYMRCPSYEEMAKALKERTALIMQGLGLIAMAEAFEIDLGKGWVDFKNQAESIGLVYKKGNNL